MFETKTVITDKFRYHLVLLALVDGPAAAQRNRGETHYDALHSKELIEPEGEGYKLTNRGRRTLLENSLFNFIAKQVALLRQQEK